MKQEENLIPTIKYAIIGSEGLQITTHVKQSSQKQHKIVWWNLSCQ